MPDKYYSKNDFLSDLFVALTVTLGLFMLIEIIRPGAVMVYLNLHLLIATALIQGLWLVIAEINPVRNSRGALRSPRELSRAVTHIQLVRNMVSNGAQERRGIISNGLEIQGNDKYHIVGLASLILTISAIVSFYLFQSFARRFAFGLIMAVALLFMVWSPYSKSNNNDKEYE